MKEFFVDTETTGVDYKVNALIQLAGVIVIDGEECDSFTFTMAPFPDQILMDEAMKINGRTLEEILAFPDPVEVNRKFQEILKQYVDKYERRDKFHMIGYNARFDSDFIREWFHRSGDEYFGSWFFFPPLDVMNLAAFKLAKRRATVPNFKLATVAKEFGLEPEGQLHNAISDIGLTRKLYDTLEKG